MLQDACRTMHVARCMLHVNAACCALRDVRWKGADGYRIRIALLLLHALGRLRKYVLDRRHVRVVRQDRPLHPSAV